VSRLCPSFATLLFFILFFVGCKKKPATPVSWENPGFESHVPQDAEGFISLRQPVQQWHHLQPTWSSLLADPTLRNAWHQSPWGQIVDALTSSNSLAPLTRAFLEADGEDYILVLQRGTAAQLASGLQVQRLFEAARWQNIFTPPIAEDTPSEITAKSDFNNPESAAFTEVKVPLSPAMEESLKKIVKEISVPPVLLGIKLRSGDKSVLEAFHKWSAGLPEKVSRDKFPLSAQGEFTRIHLQLADLLPQGSAKHGRDILAATIGDPYAATDLMRSLISKPIVLSFGEAFGYFLVMIGPNDSPPAFAESVETSLAALPTLAPLASRRGTDMVAMFYADSLVTGLTASPPPIKNYITAALEAVMEFAPAEKKEPLLTSGLALERQADDLFQPLVAPTCGVIAHDKSGWRADIFGELLAPRLAHENGTPLLDMSPNLALLWTEQWSDGYTGNLLQFTGDLSTFAMRWIDDLGPLILDSKKLAWAEQMTNILREPSARFAHLEPTSWDQAFDRRRAFVVATEGITPQTAFFSTLAIAAGLQDRKALTANWDEVAPASWSVMHTNALTSGGVSYEFSSSLISSNLNLAITLENQRWVLGTSTNVTQTLGSAPTSSRGTKSVQRVQFSTVALATLVSTWADALETNTALSLSLPKFLPHEPQTWRTAAALLQKPYQFDYEARWEEKLLHRSVQLSPTPNAP